MGSRCPLRNSSSRISRWLGARRSGNSAVVAFRFRTLYALVPRLISLARIKCYFGGGACSNCFGRIRRREAYALSWTKSGKAASLKSNPNPSGRCATVRLWSPSKGNGAIPLERTEREREARRFIVTRGGFYGLIGDVVGEDHTVLKTLRTYGVTHWLGLPSWPPMMRRREQAL